MSEFILKSVNSVYNLRDKIELETLGFTFKYNKNEGVKYTHGMYIKDKQELTIQIDSIEELIVLSIRHRLIVDQKQCSRTIIIYDDCIE